MSDFTIKLTTDTGTVLAILDDFERLNYVMSVGEVGVCTLTLPGDWEPSFFKTDRKIEIWRAPEGAAKTLERAYMIREIRQSTDTNGVRRIQLTGLDGNYLLDGRGIWAAAGSAEASKTAEIDDMMKAIIRESQGSLAAAARQWNSSYFSVQADLTLGASITKAFSNRNVLNVLRDLHEQSKVNTPVIYYDVMSPEPHKYEFRCYSGQPGQDHTYPSGVNPVLLGIEHGNLADVEVIRDYSQEITHVRGGGQNEASDREYIEVNDTARSGRSIWGRRELFYDGSNQATAGLTSGANTKLSAGRPKISFRGRIVDNPGTQYGVHWRWGDKLTAEYERQRYDAMVSVVKVNLDSSGMEDIEAWIAYDE